VGELPDVQSLKLAGFLDPLVGVAGRDATAASLAVACLAQALVKQTADGMVAPEVLMALAYMSACLPCLSACLPAFLPACLPICLSRFLLC
jgi:hypothetical protein